MTKKFTANINEVMGFIDKKLKPRAAGKILTYPEYLQMISKEPVRTLRNIFQMFHDMINYYITVEGDDELDPENINYKSYNTEKLLVNNTDTPFFSDLLLANRLIQLSEAFRQGTQQNKIYTFIGPPGSGKSTFLNNILKRFEEYNHLEEGANYEVLWRLDRSKIDRHLVSKLTSLTEKSKQLNVEPDDNFSDILEVPCPSHDDPILLIPKQYRAEVLEQLISGEQRVKIFNKKEYEWVFKDSPCTICSCIYDALSSRLKSPKEVFEMIHAKRRYFNRRLGDSISVFNPGDVIPKGSILYNDEIQKGLSHIFKDSNLIQYIYSRFAKTNNGVFALMDVKGYNEKRIMDLHGIISEGLHKIDDLEEKVKSLFIAVMNPEDKESLKDIKSLKDRTIEIKVNYNLNYKEEVKIYYHSFGKQIANHFLPRVLENFAKIIISSRLLSQSDSIKEWLKDSKKYHKYCDENMLLLKMSLYDNHIPGWLGDEDRKSLDKNIRRKLIKESENEGRVGFSGRESISIFNEFYSSYKKSISAGESPIYKPITMDEIRLFFQKNPKYNDKIPAGFINSIIRLYNYNVMQEIKEAMFQHNEDRVSNDILNYLFASNYDFGEKLECPYTSEVIEVTEQFFESIEKHVPGSQKTKIEKGKFRKETAEKFILALQEIQFDNKLVTSTEVYKNIYNSYMNNLRENIFQPLIKNTTFENAVKTFGTDKFDVYDTRTKEEVAFLIKNLINNFKYSQEGGKQMCLYIISNNIADSFKN